MRTSKGRDENEMRPAYDFAGGVRGKYVERLQRTNVVVLDPDVARVFKTAEAVNSALRSQIGKGRKARGGSSGGSRRGRGP